MQSNYEKIKITIAISVYNLKDFIEPCVKNILEQTHKNIEIVFSDDCSTDGSWEECIRISEEYDNVKAIRNPRNMLQGEALRRAVEVATGDWLIFLDADDRFETDCLERMLCQGIKNNVDIVLANYRTIDEMGHIIKEFRINTPEGVYSAEEVAHNMFEPFSLNLLSCIGTKLYRMDFIKERKIPTETNQGNYDLSFALDAFRSANNIYYMDRIVYVYLQRSGSVGHSYKINMYLTHHFVRKKIRIFLEEKKCYEEHEIDYHRTQLNIIKKALWQEITSVKGNFKQFLKTFSDVRKCDETYEMIKTLSPTKTSIADKIAMWGIKYNQPVIIYIFIWIREKFCR